MENEPDYSKYSLDELNDAASNINREKYLERARRLDAEIAKRSNRDAINTPAVNCKPRRPWLAALMTVLATGLGHLYLGKPKRGVLLFSIGIFLNIIFSVIFAIIAPNFTFFILFSIGGFAFGIFCVADAFLIAKRKKENYELTKYNRWFVYLGYTVISVLIFALVDNGIKATLLQEYKIPSRSMMPTLMTGDIVLIDKFIYGVKMPVSRETIVHVSDPKRDDIVVFIFHNDRSKDFIKRVIGVGGDKIEIKDKKVFINNKEYKDYHAVFTDNLILPASMQPRDNFGPVTVPPNSIFVIGDNRDESIDSRFWGFVDLKDIKGKALMIYFSLDREEKKVRWDRIGLKLQ